MATYDWLFNIVGLRNWCDTDATKGPMSMAQLLAKTGNAEPESSFTFAFPSLDELNKACGQIAQTRDVIKARRRLSCNSPCFAYSFRSNHSTTVMDAGWDTLLIYNSTLVSNNGCNVNCCMVCYLLIISCFI